MERSISADPTVTWFKFIFKSNVPGDYQLNVCHGLALYPIQGMLSVLLLKYLIFISDD